MTFDDFKHMEFPGYWSLEDCLLCLMRSRKIDYNELNKRYVQYLQEQEHIAHSNREEAAVCLLQLLNGNFTGDDLKMVQKRAIHTYNKTTTLPKHILDEKYGFTEEDDRYWSKFMKDTYGTDE